MAAPEGDTGLEPFELCLLGGAVERRYRTLRPEVEALPWGTLRPDDHPPEVVASARRVWTEAAFQEHRTAAACALTLKALVCARAPLDLIAFASRFPLDEMVHVELCARLAMQLGGAVRLLHDPRHLLREPDPSLPALLQAAELVVHNFCVGEAVSIPVLHGSWHAARHPLIRSVLGRIVKDEAAHGQLGWLFLDWAEPMLDEDARGHLSRVARETIQVTVERWASIVPRPESPLDAEAIGWMESSSYLELAHRSLHTHVLAPLRARGLDPGEFP